MRIFLTFLAILWQLPAVAVVWVSYVLPLVIFGQIRFWAWYRGSIAVPVFVTKDDDSWWVRLWRDWFGWGGPWVIILKNAARANVARSLVHEFQHVLDQAIFGVFFYPLYVMISVVLWIFYKDKHAYLDNWFERRARKAAGQRVDIPRSQWMHGENDRWPWW